MQGREIELKAGLSAEDARVILRILKASYGARQPPVHLRSIYFDTPARHLQALGFALRIRREKGRFIQTVKAGRTGVGGFQEVREFDTPVSGFVPCIEGIADRAIRDAILLALRATILVPQFETKVRRSLWQATELHGKIEIAMDRGWFEAGDRKAPILEMEMELKGGSPEALFDLAERLLGGTSACLSLQSKSARGYALATGRALSGGPVSSKPVSPAPDVSAEDAFDATLRTLSQAIAANLHATMAHDDPEGPHQLRVGLRRLRSALKLFAGILDRKEARGLIMKARELGRTVSALRDADVLSELILSAHSNSGDPALRLALDQHRAALRGTARQMLQERGATLFALRLQRLAALGGLQSRRRRLTGEPASRVTDKPLARQWAEIVTLGDRLSVLDESDRHNLRKNIKIFRYMSENITVNQKINSEIKTIKKLQAALGVLNDLTVLQSWGPDLGSYDDEDRLATLRAGLLESGRHRGDLALGRACRHWALLRRGADA